MNEDETENHDEHEHEDDGDNESKLEGEDKIMDMGDDAYQTRSKCARCAMFLSFGR